MPFASSSSKASSSLLQRALRSASSDVQRTGRTPSPVYKPRGGLWVHNTHTRPITTIAPSSTSSTALDSMQSTSTTTPTRRSRSHTPQQQHQRSQHLHEHEQQPRQQLRNSGVYSRPPSHHALSFHWLLRTNIPRRRSGFLPNDVRKRNFFGLGEIIGVITNPGETVRSLSESKRLIDEMRQELNNSRERAQLRASHTFSKLPGFFPRHAEIRAIERALEGEPSFTILFGASSVGKTALLREVLCDPKYHVLHFDLRIAGFADLSSLYMSLSAQLEQYFEEIASQLDGYEEFEKEAWGFKHDRLDVERRIAEGSEGLGSVKTSDIARLMEIFQSALLKYWEFDPFKGKDEGSKQEQDTSHQREGSITNSEWTHVERNGPKTHFRWPKLRKRKGRPQPQETSSDPKLSQEKQKERPAKKMPVIFFDEAHKLPALIQSTEAMKCLLDSMLVLTKQDRLCHVIHATSDPFYQTWLRQLNVMQHCKIITIGDCSKAETRAYYHERIMPRVPEGLRFGLEFERLYDAFGGKLAHWHDYVTDYVNSGGTLHIKQSSHFLQAHALLNLHLIHSSQFSAAEGASEGNGNDPKTSQPQLHPGLGRAGFRIYSPITHPHGPNSPTPDTVTSTIPGQPSADFSAMQLLKVMSRLSSPDVGSIPYFHICRDMGVRAVDGMIKGRVLELRWTEPVTKEGGVEVPPPFPMHPAFATDDTAVIPSEEGGNTPGGAGSPRSPRMQFVGSEQPAYSQITEFLDVVGPRLLPTTPIMRYAMREVVEEYEDEQSVSEYASLSDVDEY